MPRGRKKANAQTYEQQIQEIEAKITEYEKSIKELKARKKEIVEKKQKADLAVLANAVKESGKSIEDAIRVIKGE